MVTLSIMMLIGAESMEGIIFLFSLFVVAMILLNKYLKWWLKSLIAAYYAVVIYLFVKGYKDINNDYELYRSKNEYDPNDTADVEALQKFWDVQSEFVDSFLGWLHIPLLFLLLGACITWVKMEKSKTKKILIALSGIPTIIIYLWLVLMTGMLGYQP